MANNNSDYIIERFTLDDPYGKDIIELISSSFIRDETAQKEGASVIFTEQTFNIMYGSPSANRELFVRAIHKPTNEMVGFLGSIPRNLSIEGTIYKFAVPSWLCVHWQHQRKGLANAMGKKMLESAILMGYDGGFAVHEPEQHGMDTSYSVVRDTGIKVQRLITMKEFIIRVFDIEATASVVKLKWYEKLFFKTKTKIKPVNNPKVRLFKPTDSEQIYKLIQDLVKRNQIAIVQTFEDIDWMLNHPIVSCVVHENQEGIVDGFIVAWEFLLAGFGIKIPFGWLDTVHTYKMNESDVEDLANFLNKTGVDRGWKGMQTPYIPYFEAKPFKKANFFYFPKKMHLDLFNFTDVPIPDKIDSFYFDWR